jgi:hypothetical protein
MNREEIIEQQNAYYMAGYPSRRSENKMTREEIEKEVRQYLRQNFDSERYSDIEMITGYVESRENHIEILKNENANLKEQNGKLLESCAGATMMYKDLQKAKEIIKNLIDDLTAIDGDEVKELGTVKEAEQFIVCCVKMPHL